MRRAIHIMVVLMIAAGLVCGVAIRNGDSPKLGNWDFKPQQRWDVEAVGDEVLVDVRGMRVDGEGNLYLSEFRQRRIHVLDPDGKQVVSFGKKGEGPGEFKWVSDFYLMKDQLVVPDISLIHYLTRQGKFIKDLNPGKMLFPRLFIDKNRLIKLGRLDFGGESGSNFIELYNLATKESVQLASLDREEGIVEYTKGDNHLVLKVARTTPELVFASDGEAIYYGFNDEYVIHKIGLDGTPILSFSIPDREKNTISQPNKRKQFDRIIFGIDNLPENIVTEMVSQIPDRSPYFYRIFLDDSGRIHVLLIDFNNPGRQAVDIFSSGGEYLYRGHFDLSEDFEWILTPAVSFLRGELFVFAEDGDGERRLAKYKIRLPD